VEQRILVYPPQDLYTLKTNAYLMPVFAVMAILFRKD